MTVKILEAFPEPIREKATPEAAAQVSAEKPYVFTGEPRSETYAPPRSHKSDKGMGSAVFAQLLLSALITAALLAARSFGDERVREICTEIINMFR